jgi:hypothetical protein
VEQYDRARQAAGDTIIWHIHFACCVIKATDTHSECVIQLFHGNNCYVCTPQCYVYMHMACLFTLVLKFLLSFSGYGRNIVVILCILTS